MSNLTVAQRFELITKIIYADEVAVSLLEKVLVSAEGYFRTVLAMETRLKIERLRLDGHELMALAETLEKGRRSVHDVLLSDLTVFNRYISREFGKDIPAGGLLGKELDPADGNGEAGDWAGELMMAIYQTRRR